MSRAYSQFWRVNDSWQMSAISTIIKNSSWAAPACRSLRTENTWNTLNMTYAKKKKKKKKKNKEQINELEA